MVLHSLTNESVQDGGILIKQSCHLLYLIEAVGSLKQKLLRYHCSVYTMIYSNVVELLCTHNFFP